MMSDDVLVEFEVARRRWLETSFLPLLCLEIDEKLYLYVKEKSLCNLTHLRRKISIVLFL